MSFYTPGSQIPNKDDEDLDVSRKEITTPPIVNHPIELNAQVFEKPYQHSVIDNRYTANSSIIAMIPGFEYTIDYYSQVLGLDENPMPYNPTQLAVYQSYHLVKRYQLRLQSELNKTFADKDNTLTLTGNAIMYPFLIPNKGDMFIGDVGDGQAGLFTITETRQLERFKQTCWEISFILQRYVTKDVEKQINGRVVKTSHFVKKRALYGQDPIVISDDFNIINDLKSQNVILMNHWLKNFYNHEYTTVTVPDTIRSVYDPFVMRAIQVIFDQKDHPLLSKMRYYSCGDRNLETVVDLYQFLVSMDKDTFVMIFKEAELMSVSATHWDSVLADIRYSRISDVIFPKEGNRNRGLSYSRSLADVITEDNKGINCGCDSTLAETSLELDVFYSDLSVHPVHKDGTYVLSRAFYEHDISKYSALEVLVEDFANKEAINPHRLKMLHTEYHLWKPQEQFYYGLILYTLTKGFMRMM